MPFPVLGSNSAVAGYEIDNSFRFDDASGSFLQLTNGANTGEDNATLSFWFKLGNIKTANNGGTIFCEGNTSGDHIVQIYANKIYLGSENFSIMFPNLLRDPSAWYHLFVAYDTSQSTNTNRIKAYLNGVLLTNATTFTDYPDQNENLNITKNGTTTRIGGRGNSGDESFDGYLAEFHYLDGTTKAYTDFGEFNDNGVWIPIKYTGGSYGNNGFFLEFKQTGGSADASGLGADTSGNNNHFSGDNVVGATDVTTDTPTNNFATGNSLSGFGSTASDMKEGNLILDAGGDIAAPSTIGFTSGKWYMEIKSTITAGTGNKKTVGIYESDNGIGNPRAFDGASPYTGVVVDLRLGDVWRNASDTGVNISTFANNDICSLAYDADNGSLYIYKNGTIQNGGSPVNSSAIDTSKTYLFYFNQDGGGTNNGELLLNFGNPPFTISSGNSDANGYGNFEYAVPSGYYALCTKNLAEYG